MRLRGALFGCGMISEFHLRGWLRIPEVEIVALCNRTLERAEARRAQFVPEARVYSDLRQMLASERLDFIDILTTPELHYDHCLAAMSAGLHIVCQKPLCESLERARALAQLAGAYDRVFAVHENHRYRPWFQRACAAVTDVRFLRIDHLNASEPKEAYKNIAPTGVWLEYGSHLVDMMRAVLGEPLRVHARMHRTNPFVAGESIAHATFEYPDRTAVVEAGWKHSALTQSSVLLCAESGEAWYEGTLTRGDHGRLRIVSGTEVVRDETLSPFDEYVESFYLLEREFIDAVLGRGRVVQTAAEHLKTLACTFAAYESARTGEIVEIR